LAPNHSVLCHSRSPFITTVTLVRYGSTGSRFLASGDELGLAAGVLSVATGLGVGAVVGVRLAGG
jgi:hypothetical protein